MKNILLSSVICLVCSFVLIGQTPPRTPEFSENEQVTTANTPKVEPRTLDELKSPISSRVNRSNNWPTHSKVEIRIGEAKPREIKPKILKRWKSLLDATKLEIKN